MLRTRLSRTPSATILVELPRVVPVLRVRVGEGVGRSGDLAHPAVVDMVEMDVSLSETRPVSSTRKGTASTETLVSSNTVEVGGVRLAPAALLVHLEDRVGRQGRLEDPRRGHDHQVALGAPLRDEGRSHRVR